MRIVEDIAALEAIYDAPMLTALAKVSGELTPLYRQWIGAARFCVLSTVGLGGTDASPRGDDGAVLRIVDDRTLWMPDWRSNNRLDCLRNIVVDGRVSLLVMVAGALNVVRVNGRAVVCCDPAVTGSFARDGRQPKTVIVVTVEEVYFQCAKSLMRAGLWVRDDSAGLPTAGQFLAERDAGFDAEGYDLSYPSEAPKRMW